MKHIHKLCRLSKSPSLEILILCSHSTHQHLWSFPLNDWVNYPIPAVPSHHFPHPDPHLLPTLHSPSGLPHWLWPLLSVSQPGYCYQIFASKEFMPERLFLIEIWASVHLYIHGKKLNWKSLEEEIALSYHSSIFTPTGKSSYKALQIQFSSLTP